MSIATSKLVLVVEDVESIRKMVCMILTQEGYRCLEASDGGEALQLLDETREPVGLVLTDMMMPNMTGAELAAHLAVAQPSLRVVFMSGYSTEPLMRTVRDRAGGGFVQKPFTAVSLLTAVREALAHS